MRHFAFVIHGKYPDIPIPAGSPFYTSDPQKDITITFGSLPETRNSTVTINSEQTGFPSLFNKTYKIIIQNTGPSALYDLTPKTQLDHTLLSSDYISILPPFGKYIEKVNVEYGLLASKTPDNLYSSAYGESLTIPINKSLIIFEQLLAFFIIIMVSIILLYLSFYKNSFGFIKRIFKNIKTRDS